MGDGMTREVWGRVEYLAIILAGGFEYWAVCTDIEKNDWRKTAIDILAVLDTRSGEQLAAALETLGVGKCDA